MAEPAERFVIIDFGKTNSRAILADLRSRREIDSRRMENRVLPGPPFPHLDTEGQAAFLTGSLAGFARSGPIDGVIVIGHGATMALVDDAGLVLPVLDYEFAGPDDLAAEYERLRPPFAETGSPRMAGGLNLGAQLFWLRRRFPDAFQNSPWLLFWPQYWTWWLTGRRFAELSYATSHADLWRLQGAGPVGGKMGRLTQGLFPPLAPAHAVAGTLRPELAAACGLAGEVPVHVGAHDSSLALVPHAGPGARQASVVMSTGTWLTAFAIGVEAMPPRAVPGAMASLDLFGRLVPNFRFMAGKARADILAQDPAGLPALPAAALSIAQDPTDGRFHLVAAANGRPARLDTAGAGLAAVLDRLLADQALEGMRAIGATVPVHVTGPFAGNPGFLAAVQQGWPFPVLPRNYEESLVGQVAALLDHARQMTGAQ